MPASGEILLVDGPGAVASRLVAALRRLTEELPADDFALIGGLAVMTRLGRVHRATNDLDAAAATVGEGPSRLAVLVGAGARRHQVEGVTVDCIDVGPVAAADLDPASLPDDELDRAFVLADRWALDSADEAVLTAVSVDRGTAVTVHCPVARPAALVAMKLQSAPRRRADKARKGPDDYADLLALLTQPDTLDDVGALLPAAPLGLGAWCLGRIELELVEHVARTARLLRLTALSDPPTPEDVEGIGRAALRRLSTR